MKKIEFSKKFAVGIMITYGILVFLMVFLSAFLQCNLETILGIVTPIPIVVVGFYYNKAKSENLVKLQTSTTDTNLNTDNTNSPV